MVIRKFVLAHSQEEALYTPIESPFVFDTHDNYPKEVPSFPYKTFEVYYHVSVINVEVVREI